MMNKVCLIRKQSGVVLVISLIMLLLLTIIGLSGLQTTGMEEKMASNMRDKNIAFQAAESALRDAEDDIRSSRISGITGMNASCTNGLCYAGANGIDNIWDDAAKVANAVSYGAYTSKSDIAGVSAQPGYLIVGHKVQVPGAAGNWKYMYKITAIAQGGQSTTKVILHESYMQ